MASLDGPIGEPFDLIVRGGLVFDGSGGPPIQADIGVRDQHIAFVGDLSAVATGHTVDATGLAVSPGFIDIHTHSDVSATYDSGQASALGMGVTTQVVGNCGLSLGLATPDKLFVLEQRWLRTFGAKITWNSFGEHLNVISRGGIATNMIPLAGHGTLRKRVIGLENQRATGAELAAMRRELDLALEAGAWGFSSGLEYTPSAFADVNELTELCRSVAAAGGIYATHLRNEGDTLVESVEEALAVASGAGVPLQLSHHKAEGPPNWGKVKTTLNMVTAARQRGIDVQLDQYPYTAFMTGLQVQVIPQHALTGTNDDMVARLRDPAYRARLTAEITAAHPNWSALSSEAPWGNMRIGICRGRSDLQGHSIAELSELAGREPIDFVLDLLIETEGYVTAINFAIGEDDIAEVMRYPFTSIGSDGVGTHPEGAGSADLIHPRTYGTFARVLGRYVRELGVLTLPEAIHKMTGLPAARLSLVDRGRIAPGAFADLVMFDPERVSDRANFESPHQFNDGIETVIVNGRIAFSSGAPTGALAGRVLRKTT